jgi:hypothetical protein
MLRQPNEPQNKSTYSTDINLLLPAAGTLVLSPKFYASLVLGPSLGIDIFKSVSINDSSKLVLSKGTGFIAGFTSQGAVGFKLRQTICRPRRQVSKLWT